MEERAQIASPAAPRVTKMATLVLAILDFMMQMPVFVWPVIIHAKLPHALAQPAQPAQVATLPNTEPMSPQVLHVFAWEGTTTTQLALNFARPAGIVVSPAQQPMSIVLLVMELLASEVSMQPTTPVIACRVTMTMELVFALNVILLA